MNLFLDLDGVMVDFEGGVEKLLGYRPTRDFAKGYTDRPGMWQALSQYPTFYQDLQPMPDAPLLWMAVKHLNPIIITGVPDQFPEQAARNKRNWVNCQLGFGVPMMWCRAKHKAQACLPGDVIVDDWPKYRSNWEARGGIWVNHTSAVTSIDALVRLGIL